MVPAFLGNRLAGIIDPGYHAGKNKLGGATQKV
jgi:hypothetical protein